MSSSQNSCFLHESMLTEILSRLPVKDLVRFKCVSKEWNHLISDSAFVKLHLQRSSKHSHTLLTFETFDANAYEPKSNAIVCPIQDLLDNPSSTLETLYHNNRSLDRLYRILGVCNGLVCLQDWYIEDEFEEHWVSIWNPATRVMSTESPHFRLKVSDYEDLYGLAFGFGYDERNDTYQVVFLDNNKNNSQILEVSVWCLKDTCWRNTLTCDAVYPVFGNANRETCGTFLSGTLNWLVFPLSHNGELMNELKIFCYDIKKESCSYFSMPEGILQVPASEPALKVLKGSLCLSHHYDNNLIVWLKREFSDENSWSKLLSFNYGFGPGRCECHPLYMEIICMDEHDDDIVMLADTDLDKYFLLFNSRDNREEGRQEYNEDIVELYSYDFVQSLVIP